ncbi:hypothetical protein [Geothermobacter hydrogeniphilus]|uniref:Zinc-ribbon domain-containing protein n=1 Tax=Geothermobacter hydrogeniphilus TaxID=1969733 RepID=A0A1X0Y5V2_9BACT|nr:hypothetical protein [Geothermobacter hydrogeniphilus]ORJ60498.1 hypothetical protein B5V00_08010 [Geothermobacter hydrogeniphilus]
MKSRRLFGRETLWIGFWLVAGGVAVVAYNTWLLCCGVCSVDNLLTLGWPGWILLVANLAAAFIYVIVRRLNFLESQVDTCFCGCQLQPGWRHCPRCGKDRK